METDRLQGIIFSNNSAAPKKRFDTIKFTRKYFKRLLGYPLPGMDYIYSEHRKIVKRYDQLQSDCSELIAGDLYERLHLVDTDTE